jgi:hypothetical protein
MIADLPQRMRSEFVPDAPVGALATVTPYIDAYTRQNMP